MGGFEWQVYYECGVSVSQDGKRIGGGGGGGGYTSMQMYLKPLEMVHFRLCACLYSLL